MWNWRTLIVGLILEESIISSHENNVYKTIKSVYERFISTVTEYKSLLKFFPINWKHIDPFVLWIL